MKCVKAAMELYAVTDRAWTGKQSLYEQVEAALRGGVTCVQLREKNLERAAFRKEAMELCTLCKRYGVPFIVNDDVEIAMTGGADGTVSASAYATFLTAIEPYQFDILIYDGTDVNVANSMVAFVKRIAEENGQYAQLVAANLNKPDSRFVINVASGVTPDDGTELSAAQACWWVGGAEAGAKYNEGLTNAVYPNAVSAAPLRTNSENAALLNAGRVGLFADNGVVRIVQDINSLVTYTPDIGKVYHKNRVIRLCNTIANDIYAQFMQNFIGIVNNNAAGRSRFKAAIVGYLLDIQVAEGIQNFSPDDVEVLPGAEPDAVLINLAIQAVDAAEKIYMTITVA